MMRIQGFCAALLSAAALLMLSMTMAGCYTQFATTNSIERLSSPSEVDVEELAENGGNVTINNYYDAYYARFVRPTIYGFGGAWGWHDPFWDYPLWYTPVFMPIACYGWGGGWGWNRWGVWNPYFPPVWGGAVAFTAPVGTRRAGIGRTRTIGSESPIFPANSSLRYGSSIESSINPSSRRQRTNTTTTAPADASGRNSRTRASERNTDGEKKAHVKGSSESARRQSSGERRSSSYSAPSQRSSPTSSSPSRAGGGSSGSSSSGSSGRRQR